MLAVRVGPESLVPRVEASNGLVSLAASRSSTRNLLCVAYHTHVILTTQYTLAACFTQHATYYTLHTAHCTLHTADYTLHTTHFLPLSTTSCSLTTY